MAKSIPSSSYSAIQADNFATKLELRPLLDGTTLVSLATGRQFKIHAAPQEVWNQVSAYAQGENIRPDFVQVIDVLKDASVFTPSSTSYTQSLQIGLTGDQSICTCLLQHFSDVWKAAYNSVMVDYTKSPAHSNNPLKSSQLNIGLFERFDWQHMQQLEHQLQETERPYVFFHLEGKQAFFGPYLVKGDALTYQDLFERRLCATQDITNLRLLMEPPHYGRFALDTGTLLWSLSSFLLQLRQWEQEDNRIHPWTEVELDSESFVITHHPIHPMPHRITHVTNLPLRQPQDFVDSRTGVITKVERVRFSTPAATSLQTAQTWVADLRRIYDRDASAVNAGCSYTSYEEATIIAIGEAFERYCGNIIQLDRLFLGSYNEMAQRGYRCIEPEQFVLFSNKQYAMPDFPFVRFTRDLSIHWIEGINLTDGTQTLLPACLVYLNWYTGAFKSDNVICPVNYAGISAGPTIDQALANALEEVVERDAMMVWWLNAVHLQQMIPPPPLVPIFRVAEEQGYQPSLLIIPNEFGMPTVAAVVDNTHDHITTVGFACRESYTSAAVKAWTEAVALQETSLDMQRPNGLIWTRGRRRFGMLPDLQDFRLDKSYADAYKPDFSNITGLFAQIQANLDTRIGNRTRQILEPSKDGVFGEDQGQSLQRDAQIYRKRLEQAGFSVYLCNLTTPDVAATGLHVVRAIVPGLTPNFPTAYRPLGRDRVRLTAVHLGWRVSPLNEEELNHLPLPYA